MPQAALSSQVLLEKARSGDGVALDRLLEANLPVLHDYLHLKCGALLRAHETPSDLVQSVCREVLMARDRFEYRGEPQFRAWVCRVAEHKIRDHLKCLKREKRDVGREVRLEQDSEAADAPVAACAAKGWSPSTIAMEGELAERFARAFELLDERSKLAILVVRILGGDNAMLAEETGLSLSGARTLLSRASAKLAERMAVEI